MNKIKENYKKITAFLLAFLLSFLTIIPSLRAEDGSSTWMPGLFYNVSGVHTVKWTDLKLMEKMFFA